MILPLIFVGSSLPPPPAFFFFFLKKLTNVYGQAKDLEYPKEESEN